MLIIAHRGAAGYAPENTLASVELAIKQGAKALEIDIHLTKDDHLVVSHDFSVDRTTNGEGDIENLTLDDIKKLDAGSWFSKEFAGEQIPTLEEIIQFIPDDLLLNIEIKKKPTEKREIEKKLNDILIKHNRITNTLVSSFNHQSVRKLKRMNNQIKIAIAIEADIIDPIKYIKDNELDIYSYHPCYDYVYPEMIQEFQEHNIKINAWTINDKEVAKQMQEMGVDSIITNYPDIIKE